VDPVQQKLALFVWNLLVACFTAEAQRDQLLAKLPPEEAMPPNTEPSKDAQL